MQNSLNNRIKFGTKRMKRLIRMFACKLAIPVKYCKFLYYSSQKSKVSTKDHVVILNTSLETDNIGDNIIMHYCNKLLAPLLDGKEVYNIPTHRFLSKEELEYVKSAKVAIVCGTNFLSHNLEVKSIWKFKSNMLTIPNIILLAVGSDGIDKANFYSRKAYYSIFNNGFCHSVRDSHTYNLLQSCGVGNVINTGCVTTWGLTNTKDSIPKEKGQSVIFSITGYYNYSEYDKYLVECLRSNYKKLFFWPQGDMDLEYLNTFVDLSDITILERNLDCFEKCLEQEKIDYVGSRLHGGIHALNHGKRTIIISVDNRASDMREDLNLPVISIYDVKEKLNSMINDSWETEIKINQSVIDSWKEEIKRIILD